MNETAGANTTGSNTISWSTTETPFTFTWTPTQEWPPGGQRLPLAVEVPGMEDDLPEEDLPMRWEGILGFEGVPTDDGRYLMPGFINERDLPLSLLAQFATDDGHDGARVCGNISRVWRTPMPMMGANAVAIMGSGEFDIGEDGQTAARMVDKQMLRGVSLDMVGTTAVPVSADSLEELDPEQVTAEQVLSGDVLVGLKGSIGAATLCALPAFGNASVRIVDSNHVMVASASTITLVRDTVLTASAAGLAPLEPPAEWFHMPEPNRLTPLTVTDSGQVYGHLAPNDLCHTGVPNSCRLSPRSRSDYRFFHVGEIRCADGTRVAVGRIVVGGGHAGLGLAAQAAQQHYDKPAKVGAFVRASDGKHGVWLSGAVRSDAPAEAVRDMMANPPSGDWRDINGNLELVAACSVPVPGFPVPRAEYAMVASAGEEHVTSLIVRSAVHEPPAKSELRKIGVLSRRIRAELSFGDALMFDTTFAAPTAEQRSKWAKSGVALPDGSFPIPDCDYAERAIRAQGRASEGKRSRVRAHIRKRVRALGCEGDIFDKYR